MHTGIARFWWPGEGAMMPRATKQCTKWHAPHSLPEGTASACPLANDPPAHPWGYRKTDPSPTGLCGYWSTGESQPMASSVPRMDHHLLTSQLPTVMHAWGFHSVLMKA